MEPTENNTNGILQVRYFIYNIRRKNAACSVRIPSSYELARRFGLTRRVIQLELERLIASGALIGKKRIGTFTVPASGAEPLFGVTYGNGDHFMWGSFELSMLGAIFGQLSRRCCNVHDLKITERTAESCIRNLKSMALDGIVWAGSPDWPDGEGEKLYELAASEHLPLFTCGTGLHPGISGIDFSYCSGLSELERSFKREKKRRILAISQDHITYRAFNESFPGYFQGDAFSVSFRLVSCGRDAESFLKQEIEKNPPDAVILTPGLLLSSRALLEELFKRNRTTVVSLGPAVPEPGFDYICFENPYEETAHRLSDELFSRVQDSGRITQTYIEKTLNFHERADK